MTCQTEVATVKQLLKIEGSLLDKIWPKIEVILNQNSSVWDEYYDIVDLYDRIIMGTMQLWTVNDDEKFYLAAITEILDFPKISVLNVLWLGGEKFRESITCFSGIEKWATGQGITKAMIMGREGLFPVLKNLNFIQRGVVLTKDLVDGKGN